jgi:hypothetical protein
MNHDSINEEILRIKRELASKFDNDLARIVADTRSRERNSISMPPRPCKSEHSDAPKLPNAPDPNGASSTATGDRQR